MLGSRGVAESPELFVRPSGDSPSILSTLELDPSLGRSVVEPLLSCEINADDDALGGNGCKVRTPSGVSILSRGI